jgi:probable F420-dependent oxidoreductase
VKLAVQLPTYGVHATAENIVLVARFADEHGFDSVWLYDHLVTPVDLKSRYPYSADGSYGVNPEDPFYEAVTVLAHVAAVTTRVRLGTAVLIPALRHPLLLAKQVATLDRLSGGRVVLGLGTGWLREEFEALAVPFEGRGARLDEFVTVLRASWEQGLSASDGPLYPHAAMGMAPQPARRVPLLFGGHSDAALRRVVRSGDGWAVTAPPADDPQAAVAERISALRRLCEEQDRDPAELLLVAQASATAGKGRLEQLAELGVGTCVLVSTGRPELTVQLLGRLPAEIA